MEANVLITTEDMAHEQWLEARKAGIGGSDAAAIAGLNKWSSPIAVYYDKTSETVKDQLPSEAAYFGNVLEEIVAEEFSKRTNLQVRTCNAILQHPEYPWMLANVDRLVVGEKVGLECKTASEYLKKEWEGEEIPASYLLQCQHYMAVTGYKAWWIAVLIGGNKFIYKKIERDEEIIQYLIEIEKDFWLNHVEKGIPPMFDGSEASSTLLKEMYPDSVEDSEIELGNEVELLIEARDQVDKEIKALEEQKAEYENKIKAKLGTNEVGKTENYKVSWKTQVSNRIDSKRLKEEQPELYKRYTKESKSRKFTVK
ncbi:MULTISPECIES: YqaJ viral recombinase family protein [Bacillus cereus group]|uniref:YqaJ viral recombinase family protein n=3 Tax=Bacillus cereus group TaxID=86661 RepID=A0AAX3QI81_9BACI|nr:MULTISPECIES: YqaJ viral recombinase family protein [Bacillus cereus group]MCC2370049.1 YqaJ viral recombinase family protein [Bacillus cereus]MCC2450775.1 YqaJ viral recombinase family protein [Bacillus cereus]MDF9553297.1 YqaJ viral recombinase family protein [Bacillus cereus]WES09684.1 YqaJ viral recombinase family protein [Bacillus paranthracis]HDR8009668.1 YqaJ viral recombinase family protein [Bacillus cereus]